jgi:hypothetical protein
MVLATILFPPKGQALGIHELSQGPQLFLDNALIGQETNCARIRNSPTKHPSNPIIIQEHPWEKRILEIYGTVLFDPGMERYRCWYLGNEFKDGIPDNPEHPRTAEYYTCYAESEDGLHWTKPFVGREPFGLHKRHNIVIPNTHGFCVLPTPDDPDPMKKFKGAGGAVFGFSPDGLNWALRTWREAVGKNDTSTCLVRWKGEYLAFVRAQVEDPDWPGVMRGIGLSTSADFVEWTPKETILTTDEEDGYPWTQPYGISVAPYGDVLVGILWLLHLDPEPGNNKLGYMDTQLVTSRDGRNWSRVADRQSFIAPSPDSWDRGGVFPGTTLIVKDNQIRIYYTGVSRRHGEGWGETAIGLATLPADRFVGIAPEDSSEPAIVETRLIFSDGSKLLINAEVGEEDVQVELVDRDGSILPGYGRGKTRLARADPLRYRVSWVGEGTAPEKTDIPMNTPIRIRFIVKAGRLFAFQFAD